jgi:MFS family permease
MSGSDAPFPHRYLVRPNAFFFITALTNNDTRYMFSLKFLESYAYFALSQVLVIYLHDEFGTSDFEAGTAYGMFGAAITGWGLALSVVMDNLGVKKSLLIGFSISAISSTICACTSSKILLYFTIFGFYPIGFAMGIPMLSVATKRYTTSKNRGENLCIQSI